MSEFIHLNSKFRDRTANTNPCDYELSAKQVDEWNTFTRDVRSLPQNANVRPPNFVSSVEVVNVVLPYPRIELYALNSIIVDSITGATTFTTLTPHGLALNDIVMTSAMLYNTNSGVKTNFQYFVVNVPTTTTFQLSSTSGGLPLAFTNGSNLNMLLAVITPTEYASVIAALNLGLTLIDMPFIYIDFHCKLYNDKNNVRAIDNNLSQVKFVVQFDKFQINSVGMFVWIHYKANMTQVLRFKLNDTVRLTYYNDEQQVLMMFDEPDEDFATDPDRQNKITFSVTPYINDNHFTNQTVTPL